MFDPNQAPGYVQGQVVSYIGSLYAVNVNGPAGIPDSSPDYTLFLSGGTTGATGAGLTGSVPFDPALAPGYQAGQIVTFGGSTYIINVASPTGIPGSSPDYTLLTAAGATGATGVGITGSTGATGSTGDTGVT
ncbi:hypothetical protein [Paenibacillus sp. FSL K6-0108]|uniref:hypothetical protein n=1 Tax=Paenibacillus sp. FSL K6-0108 TaxID=2921417 RepID=UPI00324DF38E